ncbi:hypothetical protein ACEWK1_20985 [Metabacillus sp. YM-086]|uniref:hypothetical protein n=1 Tax=Metabacillus sp. YM-086 TaxID=3341729 RepID=UPI001B9B916B
MGLLIMCISFIIPSIKGQAASNSEESNFENLGPKVEYLNVIRGKSVTVQGKTYYVALLQGEPAKVAVVDYQTKKVIDLKELEGAKAAWSIEATFDGEVYIGTTPNEHVYKYDLLTNNLEDLGKATTNSDTVIWDLNYDEKNDRLFGVTSYGGRVFSYNQEEGFKDFGTVMQGRQYARSVVYDEAEDTLYVGVGSPAALIKWNLITNEKTNLLEDYTKSSSSVYDLDIVDGQLFAKMEGTNEILHYDLETDEMVNQFKADSRGVSQKKANATTVFYSLKGSLYEYNYVSKSSKEIQSDLNGSSAVSLDIIPDEGKVIGLAGNLGKFYDYNYQTDRFSLTVLKLPPQFVEIFRIGSSSTGDIYSSGFISGYLSRYTPSIAMNQTFSGIGQVEGITESNGKLYFGTYPNGDIYEYDPTEVWSKGSNPKKILSLSSDGQSRPSALVADDENNRLFIGSVPKRGEHSGLVTIYDTKNQEIIDQIVLKEGQSVVSATYDKEKNILYAGTSVYDGTGVKTEDSASIFKIDLNQETYTAEEVSISNGYSIMVSALKWDEDGKIFGIVDNKFIVYYPRVESAPEPEPETEEDTETDTEEDTGTNPETDSKPEPEVEPERIDIYPIIPESVLGMGKNESLIDGEDGYLYGTVQNTLFKVSLTNFSIKIFRQGDVNTLAKGNDGYLYFNSGANLWRVKQSKLTNDKAIEPTQIQLPHVTVTESPFPIARVYTKKPVVLYKKVAGNMVPYKNLQSKQAFRVYGLEGQYYHTGGGYYIYHEASKTSAYIGRVFTSIPTQIYTPTGEPFRMMLPGEEIKVFNYDNEKYDVGNGYTIAKSAEVTYFTGAVKLLGDTELYKYGEEEPVLTLSAGEELFISNTDGNKLEIGNGYYILYDKSSMEYSKS